MGRRWTDEQLTAIENHGQNIIVSAGAGSGKTAVLTERIITMVKQGVPLNSLLVLTFTNAAAGEMKERVRSALKKEQLVDALDLIDSAYITTFDSFALSIVKKYHYLLDITPNVSIIDASMMKLKRKEYLEEIMEEEYTTLTPEFQKLITDFCLKDDKQITDAILKMSDKLDLLYEKKEYLTTYFDHYLTEEKVNQDINDYVSLIKNKIEEIRGQLKLLELAAPSEYYHRVLEVITPLLECDTYDEILQSLDFKFPNLPRNSEEELKQIKAEISNLIKSLQALCTYSSLEEMKQAIISTKPYVETIIKIIQQLDIKIKEYKHHYDVYEFTDIAKLAIQVVKENPEVREELKNSFHEILVDEYQDTSDLQELFIGEISHDNVYMVGDIKQSIYRFRNANPKIFKEKYDNYKNHDGGMKIDLNKNFRSRNTVLSNINEIFNEIMDHEVGGAEYKLEHQLIFGNTSYVENGTTEQNMNLEIYNYEFPKDSTYTKEEIEAFMIAKDIKEKVESHYQVFDKDEGILRDCTYSDFAILVDQKKNFELYKKIFTYFNLPLEINKDETLTSSSFISVIKHILNLVVKETIDTEFLLSYTSVARSFLVRIPDQEIFERVTSKNFQDDEIMEKIHHLKQEKNRITSKMMLERIIEEFQIYEKLILVGDIDENIKRLEYLMELASNLTKMGYDIKQFTNYLTDIFESNIEIKYSVAQDSSDAVKIMTIHKSKGLEFYVCYFPEMSHKFNIREVTERFTYSEEYGIITPYYSDGVRQTIYPSLIKEQYLKEEISEKLRVFYVALTRAKEKMIMLCDLHKETIVHKEKDIIRTIDRLKYRSFRDIMLSVKDDIHHYIIPYSLDELPLTKAYKKNQLKEYSNVQETYDYQITELEIEPEEIEQAVYSHKKHELQTYEESLLLEAGNYLHFLFETIDLKQPNLSNLPLCEEEKERIYTFLNQDVLSDIMDAEIYKEYEFIYQEGEKQSHGIIDLLLVYPDKVKIIDYKLKNIDNPLYQEQLQGYKHYIEKKLQKPVQIYLYSILNGTVKEVKE